MTEYTTRRIIVIRADVAALANQAADRTAPGGAFTFDVALSPTGRGPATHFWCNWAMKPDEAARLAQELASRGFPAAQLEPAARQGYIATPGAHAAVFSAAPWPPADVLAALGLQRVRSDETAA